MPPFSLTLAEAQRAIEIIEKALEEGYPPVALMPGSHVGVTAITRAAIVLGWEPETARGRFGNPRGTRLGSIYRAFGIKPDWSKYKPPPPPPLPESPPVASPSPALDHIRDRADRDLVSNLKARVAEAERRAHDAEMRVRDILGLTAEPPRPQIIKPKKEELTAANRTVVLHLSDIQYGETVRIEEMDGVNRFDQEIAKLRLGRYFSKASELMTEHWKGQPPDEIVLCLGGDLISGSIHEELEITDYPTVPEQVKEIGEIIAGGIVTLNKRVKRPVRVFSVPGNHGRSSKKPRSKHRARSSFDLLATDFCEAATRGAGIKDAAFYRTHSPDAFFNIYNWHWLMTHGDAMGARGGKGFIGAIAVIVRGHQKLSHTAWRSGKAVHFILTGDLHTTCKTPWGYGNGSVAGYNEYARDLRADPEPARQNMLVVHPHYGVINEVPLYLGARGEGSIYEGPATVVRPSAENFDELA